MINNYMSNIKDPIFEAYSNMDRSAGFRSYMANQPPKPDSYLSDQSRWTDKINATSENGQIVAGKLKEMFKKNHGLIPAFYGRAVKICNELTKLVDEANSEMGRMIK